MIPQQLFSMKVLGNWTRSKIWPISGQLHFSSSKYLDLGPKGNRVLQSSGMSNLEPHTVSNQSPPVLTSRGRQSMQRLEGRLTKGLRRPRYYFPGPSSYNPAQGFHGKVPIILNQSSSIPFSCFKHLS